MSTNELPHDLRDRARKIKLLIMDCDGVLTDGRLYFGESGEALKVFHARDGQGLVDWHTAGFRSGIITGRNSKIVEMRGRQLGVEFILQGRKEKVSALREVIAESGLGSDEIAYIGDDFPDAEVFPFVGLSVAVADAHPDVRDSSHHITHLKGGKGAVRELIDLLLNSKKDQK